MINFIQFTLTRAGLAIITLLLVCFIVFSLMELVPGTISIKEKTIKHTNSKVIIARPALVSVNCIKLIILNN